MNKGICNLIMFILFALGCIVFFGCEKKECPNQETLQALRNTQQAQSYHIHKLYERIDSMMRAEDSIAFNKPIHHGEPKDSAYGVSYFPAGGIGRGCDIWVDNKRNAIYKIKWGDSLYYVTRVKHK